MKRQLAAAAAIACLALATAGCSAVNSESLSDAQQVIADMKFGAASDLTVAATVDHPDRYYRVGEPVLLSVQINKPAYVAVLKVMQSGATTLVFPNRTQPNAKIAADTPVSTPAAPLTLTADKPGNVLVEVIGSLRGDAWLFNRKPQGSADFVDLGATTRQLEKDIPAGLKLARGPEFAATSIILKIRE